MPIRCAYDGVEKLQVFLQAQGFATVVTGVAEGADGRYAADTDAGTAAWLAGRLPGAGLAELVISGVLTTQEMAEVLQAMDEHARILAEHITEPLPCVGVQSAYVAAASQEVQRLQTQKTEEKGWPVWKWLLLGAGVVAAGVGGWYLYKRSRAGAMAGFGDAGDTGCSCG